MAQFSTTHWSVVLTAGRTESNGSNDALEKLCKRYWFPLYSYVRRTGCDEHAAKDLTQQFFVYVIENGLVSKADPARGRFRSFLLEAIKRYLVSEYRSATAAKRGGGIQPLSLNAEDGEYRLSLEPQDGRSPDSLFERAWALNLLNQTFAILREEFEHNGRGNLYARLERVVVKDGDAEAYQVIASELHMSVSAVKVSVHRFRQRFREVLRGLVASTVADPIEIEAELRHLLKVLGRG